MQRGGLSLRKTPSGIVRGRKLGGRGTVFSAGEDPMGAKVSFGVRTDRKALVAPVDRALVC